MESIVDILSKLGGIGAIIFGLSAWLGKVWANRILAKERALYQERIEYLKHDLSILQERASRFSDKQFEYYMSLWSSLQDLRFAGEELWKEANKEKLVKFSKTLWETDKLFEKSRIFLEAGLYKELWKILCAFKEFEFGKLGLIELRDGNVSPSEELSNHHITMQINKNRAIMKKYEDLLRQIGTSLQAQLRGSVANDSSDS